MDNPFEPLLKQFEKIDGIASKIDSLNENMISLREKIEDILTNLNSNSRR